MDEISETLSEIVVKTSLTQQSSNSNEIFVSCCTISLFRKRFQNCLLGFVLILFLYSEHSLHRFLMAETRNEATPIDLLAHGLLNQFKSLQNLEVQLTELLSKQNEMLEKGFHELEVKIDPSNAEIMEVSLMVRHLRININSMPSSSVRIISDEEDELISSQAEDIEI